MDFSTEKEATEAWGKVSGNPSDPQYLETHQAMSRYYERTHPGETDLLVDPLLEGKMAEAMKGQQPNRDAGAVDLPPEVAQAEAQAVNDLRGKWGADYDQNFKIVSEQVNKIFKGDWEKYADFMVENGIDLDPIKQVEYSEFLLKMARK